MPLPMTQFIIAAAIFMAIMTGVRGFHHHTPTSLGLRSGLMRRGSAMETAPAESPVREALPPTQTDIAVVGGGPCGLTTALMLAQTCKPGTKICVLERLAEPAKPDDDEWTKEPERHYLMGIGGRGQKALEEVGALNIVKQNSAEVLGRMDYPSPDSEPVMRMSNKVYETQILARDRLSACLLFELRRRFPEIPVYFGVECSEVVSWGNEDDEPAVIKLRPSESVIPRKDFEPVEMRANLVVGTDGVGSTIRSSIVEASKGKVRSVRFENTNERLYKTVLLKFPPSWRLDLNYSARSKVDINLEALPTKEGLMVAVILFKPGDPVIDAISTVDDAKAFFEEHFPMFAPYASAETLEAFAKAKPSRLPAFSYVDKALNLGKRGLLLGDSKASVKPYFGLGYASGALDVMALKRSLEETDCDFAAALPLYSKQQAKEGRALVEMSRTFDHTGFRQFAQFIFPIIVDGIFHSRFPRVFRPNTIKFLQEDGYSFTEVRRRKYLDRAGQVLVTVSAFKGASVAFRYLLRLMLG